MLAMQVQELAAHLREPDGSALFQRAQRAAANQERADHLTEVNRQLGEHVSSLDLQLEQTRHDLQASHSELARMSQALAAQHAQHAEHNAQQAKQAQTELEQAMRGVDEMQEESAAKQLQVAACESCCVDLFSIWLSS